MNKAVVIFCFLVMIAATSYLQESDRPKIPVAYFSGKPPGKTPVIFAFGIITTLSVMTRAPGLCQ
jgi:hypothetical protein